MRRNSGCGGSEAQRNGSDKIPCNGNSGNSSAYRDKRRRISSERTGQTERQLYLSYPGACRLNNRILASAEDSEKGFEQGFFNFYNLCRNQDADEMILDVIAGIVSGILGAMGFGGGGILILYLTLYKDMPQVVSQGINLLFFIPSAALAVIMHVKNKLIDKKAALAYIAYGLIGVALGYLLLNRLDDKTLRTIFAVMLIAVGAKELLFTKKKD